MSRVVCVIVLLIASAPLASGQTAEDGAGRAAAPVTRGAAGQAAEARPDGDDPFEATYVGGSRAPEIEVKNQTAHTLTLVVGGAKYELRRATSKRIALEPGPHQFVAMIPNVRPFEGEKDFQRGYVYSLTFYTVTRTYLLGAPVRPRVASRR